MVKGGRMYLLSVFRRKMEFPELKRMVCELARLWTASIVLVEDKSSGMQLIQQLREDHFARVQAAPANNDEKIMRLRAQTPKRGGSVCLDSISASISGTPAGFKLPSGRTADRNKHNPTSYRQGSNAGGSYCKSGGGGR